MQTEALKVAKSSPGGSQITPGVLDRIYGNSKISSRYLCVPDFSPSLVSLRIPAPPPHSSQLPVLWKPPSTVDRTRSPPHGNHASTTD